MEPAPIKTIIFDLDGVLLKSTTHTASLLASVLPYSTTDINRQYYGPEFIAMMLGRLSEREFWVTINRRHKWNLAPEVPMRLLRESFGEIEGVRPQIIDLRQRGYRLGLLSNHVREWIGELEQRFAFESLFDDRVYSFNHGMVKPERAIYITALKRLRAKPEETLFIDDRAENLLAAQELGLRVLQFMTPHQFAHDLEKSLA